MNQTLLLCKLFVSCLLFFTILISMVGCKHSSKKQSIQQSITSNKHFFHTLEEEKFDTIIYGKQVQLFTLKNRNGIEAVFTNYGQRLITLYTPDKNNNFEDIVLGFSSIKAYMISEEKYFGATIGRYGNRINKGEFVLNGTEYQLATNNGENHLHGGDKGFESVVWDATQKSDTEIEFSRTSPDMEEGYPGNLTVTTNYKLTEDNRLIISYRATTDKTTVINLTHHSFFNLNGHGNGTINNHELQIHANYFTPVNEGLIPLGTLQSVENTPFDFRVPKTIGLDLNIEDQQLAFGKGYDHNFVIDQTKYAETQKVAYVVAPKSGRTLTVYSNEPGLQFYGGNFLDGTIVGKQNKRYNYRGAFCLETQHFPDAPNHNHFPSTILQPDEVYTSTCIYEFGIINMH